MKRKPSGCPTNKKAYDTVEAARFFADADSHIYGNKLRPYRCPLCGKMHLTKSVRRRTL